LSTKSIIKCIAMKPTGSSEKQLEEEESFLEEKQEGKLKDRLNLRRLSGTGDSKSIRFSRSEDSRDGKMGVEEGPLNDLLKRVAEHMWKLYFEDDQMLPYCVRNFRKQIKNAIKEGAYSYQMFRKAQLAIQTVISQNVCIAMKRECFDDLLLELKDFKSYSQKKWDMMKIGLDITLDSADRDRGLDVFIRKLKSDQNLNQSDYDTDGVSPSARRRSSSARNSVGEIPSVSTERLKQTGSDEKSKNLSVDLRVKL